MLHNLGRNGGLSLGAGTGYRLGMGRESREETLRKGRRLINELASQLRLNQHCADTACNFYKIAVMLKKTQGRKKKQVIAACLYLFARLFNIKIPAIDPSLLIPRFANQLEFGDKLHQVSMTAIRFVARMKRDWMAIGRRPSGLCGAALLIASRVHNFCRTIQDIIKIVKVCESTIRKRLNELEETDSGSLTIDQFLTIDLEEEADPPSFIQSRKDAKQTKQFVVVVVVRRGFLSYLIQNSDDNENGELSLEGLDDDELDKFILTDEEVKTKEKVWMALNGEFLKEQEEKAKRKAEEEAAKPPKVRRKRRKLNINAPTAGEAMEKMLQEKKLSSKIDYEVLKNLTSGSPSDLVNRLKAQASGSTSAPSTSAATSGVGVNVPTQSGVDSTSHRMQDDDQTLATSQTSGSKRNSLKKSTPIISNQQSQPKSAPQLVSQPAAQPIRELNSFTHSEPVVQSATVTESKPIAEEEKDLDDEDDDDDDEPISSAQLLGHGYAGMESNIHCLPFFFF
ncbi:BRF1 [Bugula neritina]|uniref:BRF1 n=1 Tax=Bugula neritina TaxID=10212 RepID=A0A7J7J9N9_BUGNE|nr:BRF1 [Bugula neritina]